MWWNVAIVSTTTCENWCSIKEKKKSAFQIAHFPTDRQGGGRLRWDSFQSKLYIQPMWADNTNALKRPILPYARSYIMHTMQSVLNQGFSVVSLTAVLSPFDPPKSLILNRTSLFSVSHWYFLFYLTHMHTHTSTHTLTRVHIPGIPTEDHCGPFKNVLHNGEAGRQTGWVCPLPNSLLSHIVWKIMAILWS